MRELVASLQAGPLPAWLAALAPAWPVALMALAAIVLSLLERPGRRGIGPLAAMLALAAIVAQVPHARPGVVFLTVALVVTALARDSDDLLHSECALKLLWVMGPALALSWAGLALLTVATGTPMVREQWAVLALGLDPRFLWSTALPLSLLAGLVLLGGAPFHFWVADVFQGVRPWLAVPAVVALQVCGAAWLSLRLEGIETFPAGARLSSELLQLAAMVAFGAGAATLVTQRRPERRVGTLASMNGGLMLAALASGRPLESATLGAWAMHLSLAALGAAALARFLPVPGPASAPGAPLFRRHPLTAMVGSYALLSLAGVPGTPGALFWLASARALLQTHRTGLLIVLVLAWLAALTAVLREWRAAFGAPSLRPAEAEPGTEVRPIELRKVPLAARGALWISGGGLVALALVRWVRG
jgi:NADH:ubiquinone oxidoreductase subunit 2 (subunit N)